MKSTKPVIICGTDFSEPAQAAAHVAAAIARRMHAKLLLVHAIEHEGVIAEPPEVDSAFLKAQGEELNAIAEALRVVGTEVEEAFAFGPADKALAGLAAERQARMIVVAAMGRARRFLTGSVAVRVAETAPVPTLVVRQGRRLAEWLSGTDALQIVMGDDFSATGEAALRVINDLTRLGPCEVTVAHSYWPPEERRRLNLHGPVSLTENDPEIHQALEKKLRKRAHAILGNRKFTMQIAPCWGRTDGYLLNVADRAGADLIVLGTHQRHGIERFRLGSVSRAVLNDALVSVAIVPMTARVQKRERQSSAARKLAVTV
jgi:nucleotide-binding universal stress UspA family protein